MTEFSPGQYPVSEIFESLQGEGAASGQNSLFIRFQFCNLTCPWCDTAYTWHPNGGTYRLLSASALRESIVAARPGHVVFTGGEPTLYRLDRLAVSGKTFSVETNGTLLPLEPVDVTLPDGTRLCRPPMTERVVRRFFWIVSPKLSNAGRWPDEGRLRWWASRDWGIFKFIVQTEADLEEVETVVRRLELDERSVYIGLEGTTGKSQLRPALVESLLRRGFNFSPRLHVLLWGNRRGR